MKKILRKQTGSFSPGKAGWDDYVNSCVGSKMCPHCGSDIFVNEEIVDKELGRTTFFECSTCRWKDYEYTEYRF